MHVTVAQVISGVISGAALLGSAGGFVESRTQDPKRKRIAAAASRLFIDLVGLARAVQDDLEPAVLIVPVATVTDRNAPTDPAPPDPDATLDPAEGAVVVATNPLLAPTPSKKG